MSWTCPRRRWLLLALALLAGRAAVAVPPVDPRRVGLRDEAVALIARDDDASMGHALDLLGEAARAEPRLYQALADRTLVEFLQAAAQRDEATRLQSGDELMRSGRELRERGLDELRPLVREHAADPAVARALAVYYGLEGDGEWTAKAVKQARASGSGDPWVDFAELAARVRMAGPGAAVPMLEDFAAAHPGLMRARMMLARAQFDLSHSDDSLATIDALLSANPEHESAKRLKAAILAPPPARLTVLPAPLDAPPPQRPGYLPRKPLQRSVDGSR